MPMDTRMKASPNLCTCADYGHRCSSYEIPLPKRRGLLASIFQKKSAPLPPAAKLYVLWQNLPKRFSVIH